MKAGLGCAMTACVFLMGCKTVGPEFVPPVEPVPERYANAGGDGAVSRPTEFWWQQFHDPNLDRLEASAIGDNLDLKASYLRIAEARAQVQAARAQGLPRLNASAQYTREQLGLAGILKEQGIGPAGLAGATGGFIGSIEKPVNLFQLGLDASWELDLFGKVRRSVEGAQAQAQEAVESRNDLLVTLQAEVAQNYLQLRAGQMLQKITQDEIADQQLVTDLTKNRQLHGLAAESDVAATEAQLATLQSQLPQYDRSTVTARHAIAVLTGRQPERFDEALGDSGELPAVVDSLDAGLPSTLARRRPDIRNSEAALHAATAQVGVSVASMYPDVSLAGSYGLRNVGTRYLFDWSSRFYTGGPKISLPIFAGGALVANVQLAQGQAAEAALNYRRTVLVALQEVEDALATLHDDARRTAALRITVGANTRALEIDERAYQKGLVTYIDVLTIQIQAMQARQQLAQSLLTQGLDVVQLYKALGGGWETAPTVSALSP